MTLARFEALTTLEEVMSSLESAIPVDDGEEPKFPKSAISKTRVPPPHHLRNPKKEDKKRRRSKEIMRKMRWKRKTLKVRTMKWFKRSM